MFLLRLLWLFGLLRPWLLGTPTDLPRHTKFSRTLLRERLPIILPRRDSQDSQWSLYRLLLEDAITERYTVKSLYVQIGVLHLTLLTTASVIGEQETSVSLTLAMPHGRWLRTHLYRRDLSVLPSFWENQPTKDPGDLTIQETQPQMWWENFLTRG